MRDLYKLAALVVRQWGHRWPGSANQELREIAWEAIAEALCSAPTRPSWRELENAGRDALHREMEKQASSHGNLRHGKGRGKFFERYWQWHAQDARSPELEIIERVAVGQILPEVEPAARHALLTLAETGDFMRACGVLRLPPGVLADRLMEGRRQFAALWHENGTAQVETDDAAEGVLT